MFTEDPSAGGGNTDMFHASGPPLAMGSSSPRHATCSPSRFLSSPYLSRPSPYTTAIGSPVALFAPTTQQLSPVKEEQLQLEDVAAGWPSQQQQQYHHHQQQQQQQQEHEYEDSQTAGGAPAAGPQAQHTPAAQQPPPAAASGTYASQQQQMMSQQHYYYPPQQPPHYPPSANVHHHQVQNQASHAAEVPRPLRPQGGKQRKTQTAQLGLATRQLEFTQPTKPLLNPRARNAPVRSSTSVMGTLHGAPSAAAAVVLSHHAANTPLTGRIMSSTPAATGNRRSTSAGQWTRTSASQPTVLQSNWPTLDNGPYMYGNRPQAVTQFQAELDQRFGPPPPNTIYHSSQQATGSGFQGRGT
jgi:hypothetical protein